MNPRRLGGATAVWAWSFMANRFMVELAFVNPDMEFAALHRSWFGH